MRTGIKDKNVESLTGISFHVTRWYNPIGMRLCGKYIKFNKKKGGNCFAQLVHKLHKRADCDKFITPFFKTPLSHDTGIL